MGFLSCSAAQQSELSFGFLHNPSVSTLLFALSFQFLTCNMFKSSSTFCSHLFLSIRLLVSDLDKLIPKLYTSLEMKEPYHKEQQLPISIPAHVSHSHETCSPCCCKFGQSQVSHTINELCNRMGTMHSGNCVTVKCLSIPCAKTIQPMRCQVRRNINRN
jgi:hypothetical protein